MVKTERGPKRNLEADLLRCGAVRMLQVETNLKTENIFLDYSTWNSLEPWTGSYFVMASQVMGLSR